MTAKRSAEPPLDLFVPYITNLPLRDTRETMERPFFSLAKRKRLKPIEYVSPDGTIYVKVFATPEFGMATIWDADVLIWASSTLNNMRKSGCNDLPRTLHFQAYDLLKTLAATPAAATTSYCATRSAVCRQPRSRPISGRRVAKRSGSSAGSKAGPIWSTTGPGRASA
jgi:plasmid replication initiation protein